MATYAELTGAGVTTRVAAALTGLPRSTATRRRPDPSSAEPALRAPANRLSAAERWEILTVLDQARFVDLPPIQIYATLLDEGTYLCSISTLYRILADHAQLVERRRIARHPARTVPELVATGPGQVYSWDITKLAGPAKGIYYDAYVMIDIFSRYIVGVRVHPHESGQLAADMMAQVFGVHGAPQVVHADRGTSMTSKTVAQFLADLEITRSYSRPRVSNDNPYSEAWFKTLKYAPTFPDRFGSLADAQQFMNDFVDGYNHHHRHTGIGLHTPADVHYGHANVIRAEREATLAAAREQHPERFTTNRSPKIINLPETAWINQPREEEAA
jgi:transposase InsO family protein